MGKLFVEASISFKMLLERMERLTQVEFLNLTLCSYRYQAGNGMLIYDTYLTTKKRINDDIVCFTGEEIRSKWLEYLNEEEDKATTLLFGENWNDDDALFDNDSDLCKYLDDEHNKNQWEYAAWQNTWKYFSDILLEKTIFSEWNKEQDDKKISGQVKGYVKCIYRKYNMIMWAESHEEWRVIKEGDLMIADENEDKIWFRYYNSEE